MSRVGLVFSGGGGKGAYEIGVWKALKSFGITQNVVAVAGTSVGGLNGALFVAGDYEAAEKLWLDIAPGKVLTLKQEDIAKTIAQLALGAVIPGVLPKVLLSLSSLLGGKGVFSQEGLAELIDKSSACLNITAESLPLHICALAAKDGNLTYPQLNDLTPENKAKWLLASAAIPVVFPAVEIEGANYVDGGVLPSPYSDNTPCKPLIDSHGCTHIINIFLDRKPQLTPFAAQYPGVRFWNIVPSQAFDGVIESLNFTRENACKLIEMGYLDVARILEQFQKFQKDEADYLNAVFEFGQSNQQFQEQIELNRELRGETGLSEKGIESAPVKMSYDQVMANLASSIKRHERDLINSRIDSLIEKKQANSNELLEQGFTALTTLASTEGRINYQLEQGSISRVWGWFTGSDSKLQAEINWDLNHAIYANLQLSQKLNRKQMLTMEAVTSLSNKTNYLMDHVNMLYASVGKQGQQFHVSMEWMQQGMKSLADVCFQQFSQVFERLESLERSQLINDWYQRSRAVMKMTKDSPALQLINLTISFYNHTGRTWSDKELPLYINALADIGLSTLEMVPLELLNSESVNALTAGIDRSAIFPVKPSRQAFHPLLTGAQKVSESAGAESIEKWLENEFHLNLACKRTGLDLGLELLHSLRSNDRRDPVLTTSRQSLLSLEKSHHGKQNILLNAVKSLLELNSQSLNEAEFARNLQFLESRIATFKVVIPIIGKFSSGKSTLLNGYLGINYLKTDIRAETSFATELAFSEDEHIVINYLNDRPSVKCGLEALKDLQASDDLYFVQVFINNRMLENRQNIVLVDMPGFDSTNSVHQKAIACYLSRGDVFINLLPSDIPFDGSVMGYLREIVCDHKKRISLLISKSGRKSTVDLQRLKVDLSVSLTKNLGAEFDLGAIESKGQAVILDDFIDSLDGAASSFDDLLAQRYQATVVELTQHFGEKVRTFANYCHSDEANINQKMIDSKQAFLQLKKTLDSKIATLQSHLCGWGKEQLIQSAKATLENAIPTLLLAAKTNRLPEQITGLLRPVLQSGINNLVEDALRQLESDLKKFNAVDINGIRVTIEIPPRLQEQFSLKSAAIAAAISILFLGPVGVLIAGILGGLLGRKNNEEERDKQIREQLQQQIIPDAMNQVMEILNAKLTQAFDQLKAGILMSFENQEQIHLQALTKLQQDLSEDREAFRVKQELYQNILGQIENIRVSLDL